MLLDAGPRGLLGPVRIGVAALEEVRRGLEQPLGLDLRGRAREELRRLHELERHDPRGRLASEGRRRVNREARLPRAHVDAILGAAVADLREQAREERDVERVARGTRRRRASFAWRARWGAGLRLHETELADHVFELPVDFAPLANAKKREEALLADAPQVRCAPGSRRRGRTPTAAAAPRSPSARRGSAGAGRRPSAARRAGARAGPGC